MSNFIKLTRPDNTVVWINKNTIDIILKMDDSTTISFIGTNQKVLETPEEILQLIEATT